MNPQDISPGIPIVCERHGSDLVVSPAPDGTETKLAFCRHCRRYYGRIMPPQVQARGFRKGTRKAMATTV